jgi:hypothetical protein
MPSRPAPGRRQPGSYFYGELKLGVSFTVLSMRREKHLDFIVIDCRRGDPGI